MGARIASRMARDWRVGRGSCVRMIDAPPIAARRPPASPPPRRPGGGLGVFVGVNAGNPGFAREADDEGAAEFAEHRQRAEEGEVMGEGLAEAEAGIKGDAGAGDAGALEGGEAVGEPVVDVGGGVCVVGVVLHGLGVALGVHAEEVCAVVGGGGGGGADGVGVGEAGDVVEDLRAVGDGGGEEFGVAGVDGEGGAGGLACEGAEGGFEALPLFGGGTGLAPGRVDSAPRSRMSAPSARRSRAARRTEGGSEGRREGGVEAVGGEVEDGHDEGRGVIFRPAKGVAGRRSARRVCGGLGGGRRGAGGGG